MRRLLHVVALVGVVTVTGHLASSGALAYEEGEAGEAVIQGIITFKGTPPPPILTPFGKHTKPNYCSRFYHDGQGNRIIRGVTVNKWRLQDVVVYLRNITKGKAFLFTGTDVIVHGCEFLVQGGPSTFVGVVVKGAEFRVVNDDADPSDPKNATGVLHQPHAYEVAGTTNAPSSVCRLSRKGSSSKNL